MKLYFVIPIMTVVGIGMCYGFSILMTYQQQQVEIEIQEYCPQGLDDPKNPCGLTIDSILPFLMAICIISYIIAFIYLWNSKILV